LNVSVGSMRTNRRVERPQPWLSRKTGAFPLE
jgi:hypothetical protein